MKKTFILILLLLGFITVSNAQKVAIKSNILYDATTTMNLGMEFRLARKWTLDVPFNLNPWKFSDETRLRHWGAQPEVRYWFCESFRRTFIGVHGHYADFNVGGLPDWSFISKNMQENRYQGHLYGGGVSIGHTWILKKRWLLEATVGVGYARIVYDKYFCNECGSVEKSGNKNYFGPTKAGISFIYVIK